MKKIILTLGLVIMFMVSSCGGHNEESILKKIENNEQLTESEYKFIEDYVKEADKKMKDVQEKIANGAMDEIGMNKEEFEEYVLKTATFKGALFQRESGSQPQENEAEDSMDY